MNNGFRRHLTLWIGSAVLVPLLAACAAESRGEGTGDGQDTQDLRDSDLNRIAAKLTTGKASLAAQEGLAVTVTLTNGANHPVRLLKWNTPVDGIHEPLFDVARDGQPVEYVGRHYKRPAPRPTDYVVLEPGESLSRTVDLAEAYDLSASGNYTVHYRADQTNDLGLWVEGRPSLLGATIEDENAAFIGNTTFTGGCTTSEKSSLNTAMTNAASYSSNSLSYLNGTPGSKPRYTTWFGAYTSSRWSTVKSHFTKIKDAFDNKNFVLDCSCTDDYYAYVYSNQPYKVYLCNAFWSAPSTGTDSKAGTLVHEASHFTAVAGTDDHAYGHSACKSLASSNPTRAVDNADSHEYFAENTPAQN